MLVDDGILKSNLKKVWTKYRISKGSKNLEEQIKNAKNIISLQKQLGYPESVFPELEQE